MMQQPPRLVSETQIDWRAQGAIGWVGPPSPVSAHDGADAAHGGNEDSLAGLFFDLENVLYDTTLWSRWLVRLLARFNVATSCEAFQRDFDCVHLPDVWRGDCAFDDALAAFLRMHHVTDGQIDEITAASRHRLRELERSARPFPGVRGTLRMLHAAGYQMAVVCNSIYTGERLRSRLSHTGLGDLFETVVSSQDVAAALPDASCYGAALSACGLRPAQVGFVGHEPQSLRAATRLGMRTIAYNCEPATEADARVEEFTALIGVADRWNLRAMAG